MFTTGVWQQETTGPMRLALGECISHYFHLNQLFGIFAALSFVENCTMLTRFQDKAQFTFAWIFLAGRNSRPVGILVLPLPDHTQKTNIIWIEFITKHQVCSHLREFFLAARKIHMQVWIGLFSVFTLVGIFLTGARNYNFSCKCEFSSLQTHTQMPLTMVCASSL